MSKEKKTNKDKIEKLEAEMGRLFLQKAQCESIIQQVSPKINDLITKIQNLKSKPKE